VLCAFDLLELVEERKGLLAKLVSGACNQLHARTIAPRQNAEAVVLDFVQPAWPGRRCLSRRGQARLDYPQSAAGTSHNDMAARYAEFLAIATLGNGGSRAYVSFLGGWFRELVCQNQR
jgi:hypothetical protein